MIRILSEKITKFHSISSEELHLFPRKNRCRCYTILWCCTMYMQDRRREILYSCRSFTTRFYILFGLDPRAGGIGQYYYCRTADGGVSKIGIFSSSVCFSERKHRPAETFWCSLTAVVPLLRPKDASYKYAYIMTSNVIYNTR